MPTRRTVRKAPNSPVVTRSGGGEGGSGWSGLTRIGTVRTKDGGTKTFRYGRKAAITMMCAECLGWETHPKDCTSTKCPLFPFRAYTRATMVGTD